MELIMDSEHNSSRWYQKNRVQWLLLIIFTLIVFSININSDGIYSAQEGRAAIVAQNMLDSGNWLEIQIPGGHLNEKPIMCYWFYAVSGWIFGVNELGVRVPSIIASLLSVIVACWLGGRIYGRKTGFISGYILATMVGFINLGRIARIDIVLCAFYALGMLFLYTGYFEKFKANRHLYLFYIFLALSVMTKGPVTVVLAGLTVLCMVVYRRNWKIIWELKPISGLIIGLAICAPWYIYECINTNGEFVFDFFVKQNIQRFTGNTDFCEGKRKNSLYYIPKLFAGSLPWSLLVPFCLFSFRKKLLKLKPPTYFLLFWIITTFIFFSISAIKRGDYILPLYPALAILLGRYMTLLCAKELKLSKKWLYVWIGLAAATVLAAIGSLSGFLIKIGQLAADDKINHVSQRDGKTMIQICQAVNDNFIYVAVFAVLCLAVLFYTGKLLEKGAIEKAFKVFLAVFLVILSGFYLWLDPESNNYKTVKYFCQRCTPIIPEDATVCYFNEWNTEAVFFMRRKYVRAQNVEDVYDDASGRFKYRYIVCDDKKLRKLKKLQLYLKTTQLEQTIEDHQYPQFLLKTQGELFKE